MYFITVCVKDRRNLLGEIPVGRDVLIAPSVQPTGQPGVQPTVQLSEYGHIVDKHINIINSLSSGALVDKYVIMPNHVHMIIMLKNEMPDCENGAMETSGAMKTSRPTATVPNLLRSFKTMVSKEVGFSLWQTSYHDHIIRNENEYQIIWKYINENPVRWAEDKYFCVGLIYGYRKK